MTLSNGPLTGYRILEMGANVSVPWATMLLGDQGAEVIKLETPEGDQTRVAGNSREGVERMATMFLSCNRNKQSIVLDMKSAEAQAQARAIAAGCDVVIQNFRPGVAARLGMDYETLKQLRPDIIYVSVDGLGAEGQGAKRRVYDVVVQGIAGYAAMQAGRASGGEPAMVNTTITDKVTAMAAWQAVTAALLARERTGEGQHVRVSMLDAAIAFLWPDAVTGGTLSGPGVRVGATPKSVRYIFPTADGHIIVGMFMNPEWAGLCRALGRRDLIDDPRFPNLKERLANVEAMNEILSELFRGRTTADWVQRLEAEDAVFAPVNHPDDVKDDPYVVALGTVERHDHPVVGPYAQARHPIRFERTPAAIRRHAPELGADTEAVLAALAPAVPE